MKSRLTCLFLLFCGTVSAQLSSKAWTPGEYISFDKAGKSDFTLAQGGESASIIVSDNDWKGVKRTASDLALDLERVTGTAAVVITSDKPSKGCVIAGTIGSSNVIDRIIKKGKLDVKGIAGQRESFVIEVIDGSLVIAGSDRRGTIYGLYDVSENIGVSPWYWWADVPATQHDILTVKAGRYVQPSPKVRYRGIFINDESPSFSGWSAAKFKEEGTRNGQNSVMYAHMFELILRLKANYLWPAMWGKAFNEDDPRSPALADEYGVIMGTSHHEPMMRAQQEYTSRQEQVGIWDYVTNADNLKRFWREGLERNSKFENLITIGMRGDGDVPMGQGNDEQNTQVLYDVIREQRSIISDVYGKDASEVPQMWALFTEVQRYYESGMTSPDDVLLMFCDNNWGYIRRTGPEKELNRKGGLGMYYHIDMNGGPWNDRWINTTTIPKLREQLSLAYRTGIDDLWIINVGDLKPKELPIDFIMHYAWNPDAIGPDDTFNYTLSWAEQNFGKEHAQEIAWIVSSYPKLNLMRKPEVQSTGIFSYENYDELNRQMRLWDEVQERAEALKPLIPDRYSDAFFELVYYPAVASAGVGKMWLMAQQNNIYALQGNTAANNLADYHIKQLFERDKELSDYYNNTLAGGKWKNMMSDKHIGYVQWSMPNDNRLPTLYHVKAQQTASLAVEVEGSELAWPLIEPQTEAVEGTGLRREMRRSIRDLTAQAHLPVFDAMGNQKYYILLFNRGIGTADFTVTADKDWILFDGHTEGSLDDMFQYRIKVHIDWSKAPMGRSEALITVRQKDSDTEIPIKVEAVNGNLPTASRPYFGTMAGEYGVDVLKPAANIPGKDAAWRLLPDLGRGAGCMGIWPNNASSASLTDIKSAPHLEYDIYLHETGSQTVCLGILPTQDVNPSRGLRLAISVDDADPMLIDARQGLHDEFSEYTQQNLARSKVLKPLPQAHNYPLRNGNRQMRDEVFDNLRWLDTQITIDNPGIHTLKVWMVDPEIVLEKIVINPDGRISYSGPVPVIHDNTLWNLPQFKPEEGPYTSSWDTLSRYYNIPEWWREAKFGAWSHWDPQSQAEDGDWYSRGMYQEGSEQYRYHLEHYGHPSVYGYKELCRDWNIDAWDPDDLMRLYKDMGARYFVAMGNHHDNFDCWDSKYQPWNSVNVGPKKDVVGIWAETARKYDMPFGIGFHATPARTYGQFMTVRYRSDRNGPNAGIPYDANLTAADGIGKWWEGLDPVDLYGPVHRNGRNSLETPFATQFMYRVDDAIRKYQPDMIYFDDHAGDSQVDLGINMGLGKLTPQIIENFYNIASKRDDGRNQVVATFKGVGGRYDSFQNSPELLPLVDRSLLKSTEFFTEDQIMAYPFQTEVSLQEWHYKKGVPYRPAHDIITRLMQNVSRNGSLLLNITQRAGGNIDPEARQICQDIGSWLKVNADAVYGSRPFETWGNDNVIYTRNGGFVYAMLYSWDGSEVNLDALSTNSATIGKVSKVELIGQPKVRISFRQSDAGLSVSAGTQLQPYEGISDERLANGFKVLRITHDKALFNDDDPGVTTIGWEHRCNLGQGDYNNDLYVSSNAGDVWRTGFYGKSMELIAPTGPDFSDMTISIDGETHTVSLNDPSGYKPQQVVFRYKSKRKGNHTVEIVNHTGTVAIDALILSQSR